MLGWNGSFLRINLSRERLTEQTFSTKFARTYLGGRGFAVKMLWDFLPPQVDPLSENNILLIMAGPLTGVLFPSNAKAIVAAKSPLTGGYGDGTIGGQAAVEIRRSGYDGLIIEGKAKTPSYLYIKDDLVEIRDASELWGLSVSETLARLRKRHASKKVGILTIGVAGEHLVKYSVIRAENGRSGGRPGLGAVMGSKNLKAIVIEGSKPIPVAKPDKVKDIGLAGFKALKKKPFYPAWIKIGTLGFTDWCLSTGVLPAYNFQDGRNKSKNIDSLKTILAEKLKIGQRGCVHCNMPCGVQVQAKEDQQERTVIEYENVVMLGANIGINDPQHVAYLNHLADELGIDTVGLGSVLAFIAEYSEKHPESSILKWGDYHTVVKIIEKIANRKDIGDVLAEGLVKLQKYFKIENHVAAMHVKGLAVTAFNAAMFPSMLLSYGTSPIGAHHKDSWTVAWELQNGHAINNYDRAVKVIERQRFTTGVFECGVVCRFPWSSLGLELQRYERILEAVTGLKITLREIQTIADRIYALIRAFWVREFGGQWSRQMDYPPSRWLNNNNGMMDTEYDNLLSIYYELRGWDERGIPTWNTFEQLGLKDVAKNLSSYIAIEREEETKRTAEKDVATRLQTTPVFESKIV